MIVLVVLHNELLFRREARVILRMFLYFPEPPQDIITSDHSNVMSGDYVTWEC